MRRTRSFALVLAVILTGPALLFALGGFHPEGPIGKPRGEFPDGALEAANLPFRTLGYFVNANDFFHFRGDATKLNATLAALEKSPELPVKLVLHPGTTGRPKVFDEPQEPFDWRLSIYTRGWSPPGLAPEGKSPNFAIVNVYLGSAVDLKALRVPERFEVASSGEIEKFVAEHAKK